jgi:hypothetical protein
VSSVSVVNKASEHRFLRHPADKLNTDAVLLIKLPEVLQALADKFRDRQLAWAFVRAFAALDTILGLFHHFCAHGDRHVWWKTFAPRLTTLSTLKTRGFYHPSRRGKLNFDEQIRNPKHEILNTFK